MTRRTLTVIGAATVAITVLAVAADQLRRRLAPFDSVYQTPERVGECATCGILIKGDDWWTLSQVPADIPGEQTFGGGSVLQVDYCPTHRPDLRHHG